MTCIEKFRQMYGHEPDPNYMCPDCRGIGIDKPEYCPDDNGRAECTWCWCREIPGTEPTVKPDPEKFEQAMTDLLGSGLGVTQILNPQSTEAVNHPKHYGREGAMECIDEMLLVFGVEATMNFCLLNAWKYRYRAGAKGGEEDMKKSDWYLAKFKELKGGD